LSTVHCPSIPPGYKQTEVGVIPEDWEAALLGDKVEKVGSGITPTGGQRVYKQDGRPFIRSQNVGWGDLLLDDVVFIDEETHSTFPDTEIRIDDVFLNITGASIGRSALADARIKGGNVNQHVCIIRADQSKLHPRFLNYCLLSSLGQRQIDSFQAGGNRQGLNFAQVRSIRIGLPPLPVQRAIAEALSDVDGLLGGLDRLIAKKRDLKQAAMQQLLTGQTRLPGFHGEWVVKRLGEIAKIQRGASPRPIDSPLWFDDTSPIGWVRISDVTRARMFLLETMQRLSPLGVKNSRPVATGSLIMSICATVGRPIITKIDVCIHDGFVVFDDLQADKFFVYYVLKWIEPDWSKHGQTGSQMNLNTGLINGTRIQLPPPPEQIAIAEVLTDMDAELEALEQRREKTRALKQAMMQELLTGRTRLV
jgi:type I restriction enzyme S subunit